MNSADVHRLTEETEMGLLGKHLLIELGECGAQTDDVVACERILRNVVDAVGATLIEVTVHRYDPHGVTAVALLAESHLTIHTWPEHGVVAADLFTCGPCAERLSAAVGVLRDGFSAAQATVREVRREFPQPSDEPERAGSGLVIGRGQA